MDSGWIKALELPAKITGGICLGSAIVLYLDHLELFALKDIGSWLEASVFLILIFSGSLFVASVIGSLFELVTNFLKRRKENFEEQNHKLKVLQHLDNLSKQELYMVSCAIRENSPSFTGWAYVSAGGQLAAKGLLYSPEGTYNTEHWPFTFHDFVWDEISSRKQEFLDVHEALDSA